MMWEVKVVVNIWYEEINLFLVDSLVFNIPIIIIHHTLLQTWYGTLLTRLHVSINLQLKVLHL